MAKITKMKAGKHYSYKITIPKDKAEAYIKKHGNEIDLREWGEGFKLSPAEVQDDK